MKEVHEVISGGRCQMWGCNLGGRRLTTNLARRIYNKIRSIVGVRYPDITRIPVVFLDMGRRKYGSTKFEEGHSTLIKINTRLLNELITLKTIQDLVALFVHEIAHALLPYKEKHGSKWKQKYPEVGEMVGLRIINPGAFVNSEAMCKAVSGNAGYWRCLRCFRHIFRDRKPSPKECLKGAICTCGHRTTVWCPKPRVPNHLGGGDDDDSSGDEKLISGDDDSSGDENGLKLLREAARCDRPPNETPPPSPYKREAKEAKEADDTVTCTIHTRREGFQGAVAQRNDGKLVPATEGQSPVEMTVKETEDGIVLVPPVALPPDKDHGEVGRLFIVDYKTMFDGERQIVSCHIRVEWKTHPELITHMCRAEKSVTLPRRKKSTHELMELRVVNGNLRKVLCPIMY